MISFKVIISKDSLRKFHENFLIIKKNLKSLIIKMRRVKIHQCWQTTSNDRDLRRKANNYWSKWERKRSINLSFTKNLIDYISNRKFSHFISLYQYLLKFYKWKQKLIEKFVPYLYLFISLARIWKFRSGKKNDSSEKYTKYTIHYSFTFFFSYIFIVEK